ncbi:DUF4214 domain-containing protein [Sphingobium algorifonticola]|uniref:DUF4214 domain-containing protein n=1 Tax=Sphingobium algorifonticola TaxID=2008318 RepID=A0A437J797_9SPHN|nr:DUF4214 domain-containing protein [Sphingobium algorifonticola]RVT41025.1 DUF4214 domain-containing protein [Sphingobium algorifonticola]
MEYSSFHNRNPYLRADSLDQLCSFNDLDFVRCAYVTILGRQPDRDGELHYVRRLRRGIAKLSLIRELRTSSEGRCHDPGIAGLDRTLKWHRYANLAVIGWLVRLVTRHEGNSKRERRLRSLQNEIGATRDGALYRSAHLEARIGELQSQLGHLQRAFALFNNDGNISERRLANADTAGTGDWAEAITKAMRT